MQITKSILLIFFIILCLSIIYNYYGFHSSVTCKGSNYNRTCVYKNIYYIKGKWIMPNIKGINIKCVAIRSRSSNICFKPALYNNKIEYNSSIEGITTYMGLFYTKNIGHLLWDDLYSIYLSLLKFNYRMNPFNIIIAKYNNKWKNNWKTKIFEKFSMNKLIYEDDIYNNTYLVKTLIVGLAHQCQRCINKDYSIAGGREYNATWWMRKRMYYVYNIKQCKNRYAIIINNKRFSKKDKEIFYRLINMYEGILEIIFIDWRKYNDFNHQLQVLSCTKIYISGPGTGLLNFPFISDPGIIINLGRIFRGCPSFMEQYIEEGSMHFISLYYPSSKRIEGLNTEELKKLINKSMSILNNWKEFKLNHSSNLNIEGKIFKQLSIKNPYLMKKFLSERDWAKDNGIGVWAEMLIYFPFCYNLRYIVDVVLNATEEYKSQLGCKVSMSKKLCK